ncbi:hypothetical protein LOTGIDRAFT_204866 [Lottia gigantea]|uniref:Lipocalin/cytosolic fatty-acid binding domain-containing protein n=1 Tax=Lottia gigantea TaxID=225164 RepID=V3YY52_LOTGI|nr:hypothetical protein LOTGIDRAFT_204866 [Lottia gigantea]ESO83053.1 hypothetical protein LOTGIDRAFT_204866 [Lottia gigantea]
MGKLLGNWKLEKNENWDDFMKSMGVNIVLRKVGNSITSYEEIKNDGDDWEVNVTSTFKNKSVKFKLGEPFEDHTMDGRTVTATFRLEGDKLILDQKATKPGEPDTHVERKLEGDDTMIQTFHNVQKNIVAVRVYKRYTP